MASRPPPPSSLPMYTVRSTALPLPVYTVRSTAPSPCTLCVVPLSPSVHYARYRSIPLYTLCGQCADDASKPPPHTSQMPPVVLTLMRLR